MSGTLPHFWHQPFRYLRWAAREKPAYFYSCVIAGLGPVFLTVVPPVRKYFGDVNPAPIPVTYPSTSCFTFTFLRCCLVVPLSRLHSGFGLVGQKGSTI